MSEIKNEFQTSQESKQTFLEDPALVLLGHEPVGEGDKVVVLLHDGAQLALRLLRGVAEQRAEDGTLEIDLRIY